MVNTAPKQSSPTTHYCEPRRYKQISRRQLVWNGPAVRSYSWPLLLNRSQRPS